MGQILTYMRKYKAQETSGYLLCDANKWEYTETV